MNKLVLAPGILGVGFLVLIFLLILGGMFSYQKEQFEFKNDPEGEFSACCGTH